MVLIDKAALLNTIAKEVHYDSEHSLEMYAKMLSLINDAPEAVVRCKDCQSYTEGSQYCYNDIPSEPNGFCSYGERREDG